CSHQRIHSGCRWTYARPMPAFMSAQPTPKINLLKSRRSAHAGCRAVRTACSWRGTVPFAHLAREGRMTVTIGRREWLAARGGAAAGGGGRCRTAAAMPVIGFTEKGLGELCEARSHREVRAPAQLGLRARRTS